MGTKKGKLIFILTTGLLSLMILMTVANSIFNPEFSARFIRLGFPAFFIIPLMTIKLLGLIVIWYNKFKLLKQLAYLGFLILFILAFFTEYQASDPDLFSPLIALSLLVISYIFGNPKST